MFHLLVMNLQVDNRFVSFTISEVQGGFFVYKKTTRISLPYFQMFRNKALRAGGFCLVHEGLPREALESESNCSQDRQCNGDEGDDDRVFHGCLSLWGYGIYILFSCFCQYILLH